MVRGAEARQPNAVRPSRIIFISLPHCQVTFIEVKILNTAKNTKN